MGEDEDRNASSAQVAASSGFPAMRSVSARAIRASPRPFGHSVLSVISTASRANPSPSARDHFSARAGKRVLWQYQDAQAHDPSVRHGF
jgi:hypothetical protein